MALNLTIGLFNIKKVNNKVNKILVTKYFRNYKKMTETYQSDNVIGPIDYVSRNDSILINQTVSGQY